MFDRLAALGQHAVLNDSFESLPVVIVYDGPGRTAVPYSRMVADRALTFTVVR